MGAYSRSQPPPSPSYGVVDSQSVDTAPIIERDVGIDGNKKVKGRKRHIMVDSLGLLLAVVVTAANVPDSRGLRFVLDKTQSLNLSKGASLSHLCRWRLWGS